MRNTGMLILIVMMILLGNLDMVSSQTMTSFLEKLTQIEKLLDQLEEKENRDIAALKRQIDDIAEGDISTGFADSIAVLHVRLDDVRADFDIVRDMIASLRRDLDEVKGVGDVEREREGEKLTTISGSLRSLIAEYREASMAPAAEDADLEDVEEDGRALELNGFFDIGGNRFKEADNVLWLVPFELDIESSFKVNPTHNVSVSMVNGFGSGYACVGRCGFRPLAEPFSAHVIREVPLSEVGLSGDYDMDSSLKKEFFYCSAESVTSRLTFDLLRSMYKVSIVKIEYHYSPEHDDKLSNHNEVISTQLVISF